MSDEETNWFFEEGKYGPRMVLTNAWSDQAEASFREHKACGLYLNYAKGWQGKDVSFLKDIADDLLSFKIIHFNIEDIEAVNSLLRLRQLGVNTYCKTAIDFSKFPDLEECGLEWRPKASSLFEHTGLRKVFINKVPVKDMRPFEKMSNLTSLTLASPRLESLNGVAALKDLQFFGVYVARRLTSIDGVQDLVNLKILEVNDCKKIEDISPVATLGSLEELHICNDGEIASLKPLENLKKLRVVLFYESTNIVDGDLGVLKSLPLLEKVAFMERKHYTHNWHDLPVA